MTVGFSPVAPVVAFSPHDVPFNDDDQMPAVEPAS